MSAVSRWTFYTPIIVAIIGIIGTIITVLGPSILTALSGPPNSPNIRLLVEEGDDKDKDKAKFILENVGTAPATNLTLSIDSPIKIINVTKKAGITDVFL